MYVEYKMIYGAVESEDKVYISTQIMIVYEWINECSFIFHRNNLNFWFIIEGLFPAKHIFLAIICVNRRPNCSTAIRLKDRSEIWMKTHAKLVVYIGFLSLISFQKKIENTLLICKLYSLVHHHIRFSTGLFLRFIDVDFKDYALNEFKLDCSIYRISVII